MNAESVKARHIVGRIRLESGHRSLGVIAV